MPPGAVFRLVGRADLLCPDIPVEQGCAAAATSALIDRFQFHNLERLDAVVDGNNVAVHWRLSASLRGGEPVDTEVYDLWTFDEEGLATSLVQFADTALIAHLLRQGSPIFQPVPMPA